MKVGEAKGGGLGADWTRVAATETKYYMRVGVDGGPFPLRTAKSKEEIPNPKEESVKFDQQFDFYPLSPELEGVNLVIQVCYVWCFQIMSSQSGFPCRETFSGNDFTVVL